MCSLVLLDDGEFSAGDEERLLGADWVDPDSSGRITVDCHNLDPLALVLADVPLADAVHVISLAAL